MYTRFDPVIRPTIRQTEESDPWFGINKHDREDGSRKKHDKDRSDSKEESVDNAVLSVSALRAFLREMLGKTAQWQSEKPENPSYNAAPAAYAAQAYQARADAQPPKPPETPDEAAADSLDLTGDEQKKIKELITILDELEARGILEFPVVTSKGSLVDNITVAALAAKDG